METIGPHVRTIPVRCAPREAPRPNRGKLGQRKDVHNRQVRTIAYEQVVFLDLTYGEYRARCSCSGAFRTNAPDVEPEALYDNKARGAVIDRVLDDGMGVERVIASMSRDFPPDLSDGFAYDCLHREARRLDMAEHRRWVRERFSGTPCVDELHLGRYTLPLATDPLQAPPVAFAPVARNDSDPMRRPLKDLKAWGLAPEAVVTDGPNLYSATLAELWPDARHQLCVFHALEELHGHVPDAVRRRRRGPSRRGNRGRKRRRGRPPEARAGRRGLTDKEKSAFIGEHRHPIVERRDRMDARRRADPAAMLGDLPELEVLRDFADRLGMLFEQGQGEASARGRHAASLRSGASLAVPESAAAIGTPTPEEFAKTIAFPKGPACRRVRTNDHVERVDRTLRQQEEARSKWRGRRTTVRFLALLMDRYWKREQALRGRWSGDSDVGRGPADPMPVPRHRAA